MEVPLTIHIKPGYKDRKMGRKKCNEIYNNFQEYQFYKKLKNNLYLYKNVKYGYLETFFIDDILKANKEVQK